MQSRLSMCRSAALATVGLPPDQTAYFMDKAGSIVVVYLIVNGVIAMLGKSNRDSVETPSDPIVGGDAGE